MSSDHNELKTTLMQVDPNILSLFQEVSDIVVCLSHDFHIIMLNNAAKNYFHGSDEELLNSCYEDVCKKSHRPPVLTQKSKDLLKAKMPIRVSQKAQDEEKHNVEIEWFVTLYAQENEASLGYFLIGKIKELDNRYDINDLEYVAQQIPGIIYWADKEGHYLGCNKMLLEDKGFSSDQDVIGKTDIEICGAESAALSEENDTQVLRSGKVLINEERAVSKNNEEKTFISVKAPLRNFSGRIIGIIGNLIDITKLKEREKQLIKDREEADREKQTQLSYMHDIIESIPGSIYWKDRNGRFLGANRYMIRDAGMSSREELIGKTEDDLFPDPVISETLRKTDSYVMTTGETVRTIESVRMPNGKQRFFTVVKMPLRNERGEAVGIVGNSLEITDLKETEEALLQAKEKAEAASKAKLEFISNMSHDIRTPFTGLLGISKHLYLKETNEEKKEELGYVVEAAEKLLSLLNEIIDLTKVEAGELPVNYCQFNIRQLLKNIDTIMHAAIEQRKLSLDINCEESIPEMIIGDQMRVHRILLNLVSNAVKFTKKGGVKVAVKFLREQGDKNKLVLQIEIKDTGIGIPRDKLEYVFEKFNKITPSYRGIYRGTGLGLFIVKQFVDDLKGNIKVISDAGKGTTFFCTLPFYREFTDEIKAQSPSAQSKDILNSKLRKQPKKHSVHEPKKNIRFLLIEDEKMAQYIAEKFIREMGHSVEVADKASVALELLKKHQYDIILTDIGLPDMDGVKLSKKIREELKITIPIIATTAHTPSEYIEKCRKAGIDKIIMKPIIGEKIEEIIAEFE